MRTRHHVAVWVVRRVGVGVGQRKFGLQLAGSKGSASTVGIHTLAGCTTPRVRVVESFGFNSLVFRVRATRSKYGAI